MEEIHYNWKNLKIGQLIDNGTLFVKNGFPKGDHNQDGVGVPHLRPFNVSNDGMVDLSQIKYVPTPKKESPYWLRPNDVLFNNTNSEEVVGKTAFFNMEGNYVLSNHMTIVRTLNNKKVNPFFLAKLFHLKWLNGEFRALCHRHVNQASVSLQRMKEIVIQLPPKAEQDKIAQFLFSVQQAMGATKKVIAAARQLKASLMKHLFTYGPVPFDQADKVPLKETPYGPIQEFWQVVPLEKCATVQTGVAKGRKFRDEETILVPYLRVANVQDGRLDLSKIMEIRIKKRELQRYSLQSGDVVLTEGGDFDKLGRGFIWEGQVDICVHQNHIFSVRPLQEKLSSEFLAYLIQCSYGKSYFLSVAHKTTNLACINSSKLKRFPVVLPSHEEQFKIVSNLSAIDKKINVEEKRLSSLADLFDSLLHHLMTGKLRVKDIQGLDREES